MKRKIQVLGIVNLTDDSYFAPSRVQDTDALLGRVGKMLEEGADWIDIGACSTRPGSHPVGAEEDWRRLEPALEVLRKAFPEIRISIDTYWASVVERVFDTIGPFLVNDISAGAYDESMLPLVGRLGLPYVAMHMRGTPETMQRYTNYEVDITRAVISYFKSFAREAEDYGIRNWILDPGFGFAKTIEQNYELLMNMDRLKEPGRRILVGVSRKSMIYKLLGITPEEALAPTQVLHFVAMEKGADILRVHDVAEAVRTAKLYSTMYTSSPGAANL